MKSPAIFAIFLLALVALAQCQNVYPGRSTSVEYDNMEYTVSEEYAQPRRTYAQPVSYTAAAPVYAQNYQTAGTSFSFLWWLIGLFIAIIVAGVLFACCLAICFFCNPATWIQCCYPKPCAPPCSCGGRGCGRCRGGY